MTAENVNPSHQPTRRKKKRYQQLKILRGYFVQEKCMKRKIKLPAALSQGLYARPISLRISREDKGYKAAEMVHKYEHMSGLQ